ncbi:MAG: hypothetical protein SF053_03640 [Bacteroidia bacterium]|nr:hypothetical protein [Bacteroidia bacterium]
MKTHHRRQQSRTAQLTPNTSPQVQLSPPGFQVHSGLVQREDAVDMPATTVTSGMPTDTSSMRGHRHNPDGGTFSRDAADIEASSVAADTPVVFSGSGWDAQDILHRMGQFDRMEGTDSDADRCVQAVALASHILQGPQVTASYLSSISLQALIATTEMTDRIRTALRILGHVRTRIEQQQLTYGDLYWAQEAIHDMFYQDDVGTPEGDVRGQITPLFDLNRNMQSLDTWCDSPDQLMAQGNALQNGEQLVLTGWLVSYNSRFYSLPEEMQERQRATYTLTDDRDRPIRSVTIRRIDASTKPNHSRIDRNRDGVSGHQMLLYKDAANGHVILYEPELVHDQHGEHRYDLTANSSVLSSLVFHDQPDFEQYHYAQILGKITPQASGPSPWAN